MAGKIRGVTGIGNYNAICQVCGWKYKASELKLRWDGVWCCEKDWETRHPMDFFRVIPDQHPLPFVLPDLEDVPDSAIGYVQLDGTASSYLWVPKVNPEFDFTYPMTVEFWVYAVPGSLGTAFRNIVRNEGRYIIHNQGGGQAGKFRFIIYDTPTTNAWSFPSTYVLPQDSSWYKFEFTAVNNLSATLSVYDETGTQVSTEVIAPVNLGVIGTLTTIVSIGGTPLDSTGSWKGGIDELRVWNTIRTANELSEYRFKLISGGEPGLKLYTPFDSPNIATFDNRRIGSLYTGSQGFRFVNWPAVQWKYNTIMHE